MTISKLRSWFYWIAKILGDIQAILSPKKGAVGKRIARRIAGRIASKTLWNILK